MKTHRHRRHSTEFKLRIVQAYLNGEGSIKGIARQHDISHNLLRIWLEKFRRRGTDRGGGPQGADPGVRGQGRGPGAQGVTVITAASPSPTRAPPPAGKPHTRTRMAQDRRRSWRWGGFFGRKDGRNMRLERKTAESPEGDAAFIFLC
jgi:transposase-like protein